ncbi:MAG: hypothetical protein U5N86_00650 [Planctomycetota bacterium]|nr:hypothetical protein [Planctomycetota bacterium]
MSERRELQSGLKKYARINEMALNVVAPGGLFVSCSCSGLVKPNDLLRSIAIAASRAKRDVSLIEMRGQAPCHPVSPFCPETSYLKCALLLVR